MVWASGSDKLYKGAPEHCRRVSSLEGRRIRESSPDPEAPRPSRFNQQSASPDDQHLREPDVLPQTNPEPPREDTPSIETLSQPDEEPSRQASGIAPVSPEESRDAVGIPVPETDDELFSEGGYAFACDATRPMAWRTEVIVTDADIARWREESQPSDMAFMVTASKKQHSEVKLTELTPEEQELFAQAKASEINNWLSNKAVEKVLRSQIPANQILRCRMDLDLEGLRSI